MLAAAVIITPVIINIRVIINNRGVGLYPCFMDGEWDHLELVLVTGSEFVADGGDSGI
jgi:hypothetical protein